MSSTTIPKPSSASPSSPPSADAGPSSCFTDTHGVMTTTTNDLPGYRVVRTLGTVYGLTVRSRNLGVDLGAVLKGIVGGEIGFFTKLMYKARNDALERLVGETIGRRGNAVLALRFDCGATGAFAQVCAYGTACLVEKIE